MGVFQDLEYPDNNNRANRATELTTDIKTALFQLQTDKAAIDLLLQDAEAAIKKAYGQHLSPGAVFKPVDISSSSAAGDWVAYVADLILPILAAKSAGAAIDSVFVNMLVSQGRIGEAAFANLVGLPTWMKWGSRVGGAAAAAVAFVAVDAVISSITGALQRDKLKGMIHELFPKRHDFEKKLLQVDKVKTTLAAVCDAYDGVAHVITDANQLDQIAKALVKKHELDLAKIDDAFVTKHLAALDASRSSWTNEDSS